jgi:hypothetical protein
MKDKKYPKKFLVFVKSITNKRAKTVIDHILANGKISTEELKNLGYNHPPRAVRDVREAGIPIETIRLKGSDGRSMAVYKFGDVTKLKEERLAGRMAFSKEFKNNLYKDCGGICTICRGHFELRYLQVDHRIPYEVGGDKVDAFQKKKDEYMLICGSCNRAKSWSCEHCVNLQGNKSARVCKTCYWGSPEAFNHVATEELRRLDIQWQGKEVVQYDQVKKKAEKENLTMPEFVKKVVAFVSINGKK